MRAIRTHKTGGPEVLSLDEVELPAPGQGQARVRHHAIGVNYLATYHRIGLYPMPLPLTLGCEGAGEVTAIGPDVSGFKVGDRVAYTTTPGSYAEERNERLRRLRFVTEIESTLSCDFEETGRARRRQFFQRLPVEPKLASHFIANFAGPEAVPADVFTPAHRAYVFGEA